MEVISSRNNIRITPRKMRLVAPLVKDMPLAQALVRLQFTAKDAARPIIDVMKTARADAIHNHKLDEKALIVKDVEISAGPTYRRVRPASKGKIHGLAKRTSHLKVTLESADSLTSRNNTKLRQTKTKEDLSSVAPTLRNSESEAGSAEEK